MKSSIIAVSAALVAGASAAVLPTTPTKVLQARATTICGQWDSVVTGSYTVYQDLWNEDSGTGSQCSTVDSLADNTLVWSTSWSWSGGTSDVKSFANVVTTTDIVQLSSISAMSTTWDWSYTGTDIVADVAYDMFTSSTSTGSDEYEIMIWLDAIGGAGPISSTGSAVATPTINDISWSLYSGLNGAMTVYSFVASTEQTSFSGDLTEFFTYLIDNEGLSDSQYLLSVGAGTEPFTGTDAVFSVSGFSLTMTQDTAADSDTSTAAAASTTTAVAAAATTTAATSSTATDTVAQYGQCGGSSYTGSTTCASPYVCTYSNSCYSQCL